MKLQMTEAQLECQDINKQLRSFISNTKSDKTNQQGVMRDNCYGFIKYRTPKGKEILVDILNYYDEKLYVVLDASEAMEFFHDVFSIFDCKVILSQRQQP